jgi:hypothetical protein
VSDTGLADPALAAALTGWQSAPAPATRAGALAALAGARVFVAVTARSTGEHLDPETGLRAESGAQMSLLTLAGSSGRGLPVFLDVAAVVGFADGARPVPVRAPEACAAALQDGAVAVVVDPAGAALVLTGAELAELAAGRVPVPGAALSTRTAPAALAEPVQPPEPALLAALAEGLRGEPVVAARLLDGPDGLVLGIVPDGAYDAGALAALAARLAPRLPAPLDLTVVGPDGPGVPVPLPRRRRLPVRPSRWSLRPGR